MEHNDFFERLYQDFNARNIDLVIAHLTEDVQWANGMEGGFVHGHDGVREYWTRQFKLISSNVTPVEITEMGDDLVHIKVHQVVHDLEGQLLDDQMKIHAFHMSDGKIAEFNILED